MATDARKMSESGYYHAIARGNGRQLIFEDDDDRLLLLQKLEEVFAQKHIVVIAWCLMGNHFHLALLDREQALSAAFQAVLSSYARIYNRKTGHSGHLFDARFWSEPIKATHSCSRPCAIFTITRKKLVLNLPGVIDGAAMASMRAVKKGLRIRLWCLI